MANPRAQRYLRVGPRRESINQEDDKYLLGEAIHKRFIKTVKVTNIIMDVETISEKLSFSKWFLMSSDPYSNPCFFLESVSDKYNDIVCSR